VDTQRESTGPRKGFTASRKMVSKCSFSVEKSVLFSGRS
jgi:hypothetical protein